MELLPFGNTGLQVSRLGLGAGQVGDVRLDEAQAAHLLNLALDLGITLIDTARGYSLSERRIGQHLARRRSEFVLSTKVGYGVTGHADWTYGAVLNGIAEARQTLRAEVIDIVHLHSCDVAVLERGEALDALDEAQRRGWIRARAYSGENEALAWAIRSGRFDSIECSINICDQRALDSLIPEAQARGLGVIAKRPLANAPWKYAERPTGHYVEEYWWRWTTMQPDLHGLPPDELALRFTAFQPGVHTSIAGTANPANLRRNVDIVARGPLPADQVAELRALFAAKDPGWWVGQV